ncbi:MAG: tetratricopeptide repeat-containing sensor histidine kinase [Chitinophagaceae bacterium]
MLKPRWFIAVLLLIAAQQKSVAQKDTGYLKTMYDRALDFDESKLDSLLYCADFIEKTGAEINFPAAKVLALRLKGIYQEYSEEYDAAANSYLRTLEESRKLQNTDYESAALSDLAILYSRLKQPVKAMEMYRKSLDISRARGELGGLITAYSNIGALHNQVNSYDSALYYLLYAQELSRQVNGYIELSTLYNNLGNVHFKSGNLDSALYYFRRNLSQHKLENDESGLWIDYLNIADVFIEKERFDSALHYANNSLKMAITLHSRTKEADSYAILAKYYEKKHSYPEAFTYLQKWYSLDTALVNSETNRRIADLQEKYNAQKRENDNRKLTADLFVNKQRQRYIWLLAFAFLLIAVVAGFAFITKRRANKHLARNNALILEKNEKLAILNQEKNALISIVSHDLSSPFVNVMMWGQLLQINAENLTEEQQTAVKRILTSASKGEQLIRNILDVEKAETNGHLLQLEKKNMEHVLLKVLDEYKARAEKKNISLQFTRSGKDFTLLTDAHLVTRIMENLLSNAIKFSNTDSLVKIHLEKTENNRVRITVEDEGVGIPEDELPQLFTKYSRISSTPTDGEHSTGLGLSIVKRLVEELNGSIACTSKEGVGTAFHVTL